jgi:MinD-like ATPase involved in chromosome partitioning or flagellar assembly
MSISVQEEMIINGTGQHYPCLNDNIAQGLIYGFYEEFIKCLGDKFNIIIITKHSNQYSDALPYIEVLRKQKIKTAMRASDMVIVNIMYNANVITASCTAEPGYVEKVYNVDLLNPNCIEILAEKTTAFVEKYL